MQIRLLLGPAGSGKTFRCVEAARAALAASSDGPALVLLAPKQSTYQLERQLLEGPSIAGYTRLQVLSFERLAGFVFERLGLPTPAMLDEDGRVMVLRGIITSRRKDLKLFRASARLTGFAQQLSQVLSEFQRNQNSPTALREAAQRVRAVEGLAHKLDDLATLLEDYLGWLERHELQDAERLLPAAEAALKLRAEAGAEPVGIREPSLEHLWVDGFAEIAPQEQDFLASLLPHCAAATITFCLDEVPTGAASWLSSWSIVRRSFEQFKARLEQIPGAEVSVEVIGRHAGRSRFSKIPALARLEKSWGEPLPSPVQAGSGAEAAVTLATCADPETEAVFAAREIVRHVRNGGRYREVTVLVRSLELYHMVVQRVFARYEIPVFLDRREPVAHHPLAELTRSALRTVVFDWQAGDWFAALKTGLVPALEDEIDRLENEALARGWQGTTWLKPITIADQPELTDWVRQLQRRIMAPFNSLAAATKRGRLTGPELARALAEFWADLQVQERLQEWATPLPSGAPAGAPSLHATVWEQMQSWLDNVDLGFREEALPLRDWLPILDAGLGTLSVGVIPPALDQVVVGAIDRSRNPQSKLVIVMGLNEGVFPARPDPGVLLTENDRLELENRGVQACDSSRRHLSRERYYAYVACTRATERLVLTRALEDADGAPLNPSPFFAQVQQIFPQAALAAEEREIDWRKGVHVCELAVPLLRLCAREIHPAPPEDQSRLSPLVAEKLYGRALRTSVSRLEQFAACPFKFFVYSGLRAEERRQFELDARERGTFQHDVLALFHEQLRHENKRWRDLTPEQAREQIGRVGEMVAASYREGLLRATVQTRFTARMLISSMQDFVATVVAWMRGQYQFDPVAEELPFGEDAESPPWTLDLGDGRQLQIRGRIDRVDVFREPGQNQALAAVIDYKSGQKQLDPLLVAHGIQLQLLAYLNVLRHWPSPGKQFGADKIVPVGAFYVSLAGKYDNETNRVDALAQTEEARKLAYRHTGRFDRSSIRHLDSRSGAREGDQFNYSFTNQGEVNKRCREPLAHEDFVALLDSVEATVQRLGREIFAGDVRVAPFRKSGMTACQQCEYQAVCRIDPWTQNYRVLRKPTP